MAGKLQNFHTVYCKAITNQPNPIQAIPLKPPKLQFQPNLQVKHFDFDEFRNMRLSKSLILGSFKESKREF